MVIEVDELECRYGTHVAVRGVSFGVERGEVFALLGANGAGKTTTLETLEGHHAPAAGRVRVLGHDPLRERRAVRPRVGIMLQTGGFAGELTVRETVELWAALGSRGGDVAAPPPPPPPPPQAGGPGGPRLPRRARPRPGARAGPR